MQDNLIFLYYIAHKNIISFDGTLFNKYSKEIVNILHLIFMVHLI